MDSFKPDSVKEQLEKPIFILFQSRRTEKKFLESGLVVEELYSNVAGSPFDPEGKEFAVVVKKA